MQHTTMYGKISDTKTTTITLGSDDRGIVRTVKGDDVQTRPLLFPALLTFDDHGTIEIPDRSKLDSVLSQRGYLRLTL